MRLFAVQDFGPAPLRGARVRTKLMIVGRRLACALAAALLAASRRAGGRNCPPENKKPTKAEPAKTCDVAGNPGVLAANGVCVRLSGYISSQFSGGNLNGQYK